MSGARRGEAGGARDAGWLAAEAGAGVSGEAICSSLAGLTAPR